MTEYTISSVNGKVSVEADSADEALVRYFEMCDAANEEAEDDIAIFAPGGSVPVKIHRAG